MVLAGGALRLRASPVDFWRRRASRGAKIGRIIRAAGQDKRETTERERAKIERFTFPGADINNCIFPLSGRANGWLPGDIGRLTLAGGRLRPKNG